jgi:MoaA/NifB/PqqE/SkfB family radical SAM enzyme
VEKTLRAIDIAVRAGFQTIVRFTLSSATASQMISCFDQAMARGASQFQIKPLMKAGRARGSDSFLTREELNELFMSLRRSLPPEEQGEIVILCWQPDPSLGMKFKLCGSIDKIYIKVDLSVIICNYVPEARELGDLGFESLDDILHRKHDHLLPTTKGLMVKGCSQAEYLYP